MDKKRLQELGGVVAETTEQEKALEVVAAAEPKVLEEGMFGREGYGGEKDLGSQMLSRIAKSLRMAKVAFRDGRPEEAAKIVDQVYSEVSTHNRG